MNHLFTGVILMTKTKANYCTYDPAYESIFIFQTIVTFSIGQLVLAVEGPVGVYELLATCKQAAHDLFLRAKMQYTVLSGSQAHQLVALYQCRVLSLVGRATVHVLCIPITRASFSHVPLFADSNGCLYRHKLLWKCVKTRPTCCRPSS